MSVNDRGARPDAGRRIGAWAVHLFTAGGTVVGLLALEAIASERWREALLWMAAAMLIDGVDGTLARLARVKHVLPRFDGALLDNIVDYFNYVLVPAFFLHRAGFVPGGLLLPAAIAIASAYQFCHREAKTEDHYFRGFPSYWNILAFYLFFLAPSPGVAAALVVALVTLVFVPIRYVYPSRTARWRAPTLVLTGLWLIATGTVLLVPDAPAWICPASLLYVAYYVGTSVYFALRPSSPPSPSRSGVRPSSNA
ncbi:MAG: CDP-alcohol phosphatidyltransferase family protein [Planctomycetota bacterium]|jgi:phosphatidylcholine synthase